jgi:hypothetical protein
MRSILRARALLSIISFPFAAPKVCAFSTSYESAHVTLDGQIDGAARQRHNGRVHVAHQLYFSAKAFALMQRSMP